MFKKLLFIFCIGIFIFHHASLAQKKITISGEITDTNNGEALIGATVRVILADGQEPSSSIGTTSNVYGFYSLSLAAGEYLIQYSYVGYVPKEQLISLNQDQKINIDLSAGDLQLEEVVISSEREDANVKDTKMSRENLKIETIKSIPALFGEVDVFRSLQFLPGIASAGEGTTGLFVRGGSNDQNLVLLDEATVYNPAHFLGFFSVFNPDAIKNVEIYKGGIPSKFGMRISSVLDIQMREGNNKRFAASGGIGTISSRATIEGPIVKDKGSFIASARRTYADVFLRLSPDEDIRNNVLYFYDLNGKANYRINENNKIFLSGYAGRDVFSFDDFFGLNWGNTTGTLRLNSILNDRLFLNSTLTYSNFDYGFEVRNEANPFDWNSSLEEVGAKFDFNYYLNPKNNLYFGSQTYYHAFNAPRITPREGAVIQPIALDNEYAIEHGFYIGNEQEVSDRLSLEYGLRYSFFQNIGPGRVFDYENPDNPRESEIIGERNFGAGERINHYDGWEPRFGARYILTGSSSIKASYNRIYQYLQIATNATAGLPTDRWIPVNEYIRPLIGDQIAAGYFRNFKENTLEFSVELYYKWIDRLIDFRDGASILLSNNLETETLEGRGWAYGSEFMLKKSAGATTGWISYTIGRTMRQVDGINLGNPYPARFDQLHDLSLVVNHQFNKQWEAGGTWVYTTGNAVTFPQGRYRTSGQSVPYFDPGGRNANRMPDFHRMDVSVTYTPNKKKERRWESSYTFSVYNVYGRRNPFAITFEDVVNGDPNWTEEDGPIETIEPKAVRLYLFRFIPAITYNFKF
ncbi:MAG: TonB-dependent receptor [Cyclobacteriaceae bacterium]|nr:TonB-dependent receptor [Cyclobacteriaceae bacterium]MCH8516629.1 TonB-dependent receptor [Cyclobacteriaceae bacterium]